MSWTCDGGKGKPSVYVQHPLKSLGNLHSLHQLYNVFMFEDVHVLRIVHTFNSV